MTLSLSIEDLRVDRDGVAVVRGLSYTNDAPAWIGLIGANGSGKTTLLRALAGRLPAQSGRIVIGGVDCSRDRAARAERIGFAVEGAALPGDLSPREVFAISARREAALDDPALRRLREALDIEPFIDRRCGQLSAGMAQRVAVFSAFLDLPGIVVLDEPFNWLDPVTAFDVKSALAEMVDTFGLTLITALHDVTTLVAHCDRGLLMSSGRIALALEGAELLQGLADPRACEAAMVARLRAAG